MTPTTCPLCRRGTLGPPQPRGFLFRRCPTCGVSVSGKVTTTTGRRFDDDPPAAAKDNRAPGDGR